MIKKLDLVLNTIIGILLGILASVLIVILGFALITLITEGPTPAQKMECECSTSN